MGFRTATVRATPDLQRVLSLPRRRLSKATAARRAEEWTSRLRCAGAARGAALRDWQGMTIHEAVRVGGALAQLPVGTGKTILLEVLPVAMQSKRAILVIPAGLREKTYADRRAMAGTWQTGSPPPRIVGREELALEANYKLLETINPDLILIDEADELANWKSSAVRRLDRFIAAKRKAHGFKSVRVVAVTGTLTRNSILGYWHLLRWCLGDMAPVPASRAEAETWAAAIDNKDPRQGFRPRPGPLGETLKEARAWYLDRLERTPGVLLVDEDSAEGVPLRVSFKVAPECPVIDDAFERLYQLWESPTGEPVTDALSTLRISGQAGCGLATYYDPPPPLEWSAARSEFAAFVRKRIADTAHSRAPLDTEAQVARANPDAKYRCVKRKRTVYPVREWLAVKHTFDPLKASRTKWLSDATLKRVAKWIAAQQNRGRVCVVWTGSVEFGVRLAKAAGVPYYGREGREISTGRDLHAADPKSSMVCSWHANKRGFNLQAWGEHAIVYPPQSAKYLEQIFGRAHRSGRKGAVHVTLFVTSGSTLDAFDKAISEARFAKGTAKSTQKILRAEIDPYPELPEGLRWVRQDI